MKKFAHYLYSIIFWISRAITVFLFGVCLVAVLNAKYIFSETFFSNLLLYSLKFSKLIHQLFNIEPDSIISITKSSLFTDPATFDIKYKIYKLFCINSQNIDILIIAFILILVTVIIIKYIFKNKKEILSITLSVFLVYLFIFLFTKNFNILFLALITPSFFIILYLTNSYLPLQHRLMLIPIIGEIFCINNIIEFIYARKTKHLFFILIASIILSNVIFIFLPFYKPGDYKIIVKKNKEVYSLNIDPNRNRFLLTTPTAIFDIENKKILRITNKVFQNVIVNWEKNEMYCYHSNNDDMFYIIDINTRKVKKKMRVLNKENEFCIAVRLICDDEFRYLAIVFESDYGIYIIDLKNFEVVKGYDILGPNDSGIYNKFRKSFMISYFQMRDVIEEIKLEDNSVNAIPVGSEQGYMAISEKNKEVYITFHQQGRIGVYDAETMKLKRKIKTNYIVRDITYDKELNLLILSSYFTGYIDIFLMDGSDKLLIRKFVGYDLREARFDTKKENLYVCSRNGLYKVPLNIKELIKKYKDVSHETKNSNL